MLFIDTPPSSHQLPGLTKANCHRATWVIQRPQWGWGSGRSCTEHPTLESRLRQMGAPRPEVFPASLHTFTLFALF